MEFLFHRNSLMPRLTAIFCAICVVVFIGVHLAGDEAGWMPQWGYYSPDAIWTGKPWALITSVFVHFEIWHIAFNLYWLWMLGNALEDDIGVPRYLLFFLGAAWVSSAAQLFFSGQTGIGISGVGYALFGFGWVARRERPEFARLLDDRTVQTFMIWFVGCIIATQLHLINIGNVAHGAGLLFGAAVAAIWIAKPKEKWHRPLFLAGFLALMAASIVPLQWCPLSSVWTGVKASQAHKDRDYATAIRFYEATISRGGDESWALSNLAIIYGNQNDGAKFDQTLARLGKVDEKAAAEVRSDFGVGK